MNSKLIGYCKAILAIFMCIVAIVHLPAANAYDPSAGVQCHSPQYDTYGYGHATSPAFYRTCANTAGSLPDYDFWYGTLGGTGGTCYYNKPNGTSTNFGVNCNAATICEDGANSELALGSTCPNDPEPEPCQAPTDGLAPFDTPECGCSDPDYSPVNGPNIYGCAYTPQCPESGSVAATGCTGPNGVAYNHSMCMPLDGSDHFCGGTFNSSGTITHNGGAATIGCSVTLVANLQSEYGCSNSTLDGANLGGVEGTGSTVGTSGAGDAGQGSGTPDNPADSGDVPAPTSGESTLDDGGDGVTVIEGDSFTDENGQTTTSTTSTTTYNDNTSDTTTTSTIINSDGQSQTRVVNTDRTGQVTTSVTDSTGRQDCVGVNCQELTGMGTTAGTCDERPICTASPYECAALNQEWNLQCASTVEGILDCKESMQCAGDPLECAMLQLTKAERCNNIALEGLDEGETAGTSLGDFQEGIDDGGDYNGTCEGENCGTGGAGSAGTGGTGSGGEFDLSDMTSLVDDGGLGWSGSCPAPITVDILGSNIDFTYELICGWAAYLNLILLALGWYQASIILMRAVGS